ncbi:MAG: alcohol dehydrogenase catalytic domain-containing protein [Nitrosotalea sp.]
MLVKVESAGVCHSDIHLWDGGYEGSGGQILKTTDRGIKYPLTPGHEVAGVMESMGEEVEGFAKNDKVLVFPWIGEGSCPSCRVGEENLCDKPGALQLNLVSMPTRAYKLIGSYTGSMPDMLELVSLAQRDIIKPVIPNKFKLNQATEALTMLKQGKIIGRGIINP